MAGAPGDDVRIMTAFCQCCVLCVRYDLGIGAADRGVAPLGCGKGVGDTHLSLLGATSGSVLREAAMKEAKPIVVGLVGYLVLRGCGPTEEGTGGARLPSLLPAPPDIAAAGFNSLRNAYLGDLHVHTANSLDCLQRPRACDPRRCLPLREGRGCHASARLPGAPAGRGRSTSAR